MSSPTAAPNVPIEFWTDVLEKEIDDSLAEFKKHADHISRSAYLGDFSNSLISFGMRQVCSSKLALSVIKLFEEEVNIQSLNGKAIENLIFFIDRVPISKMQIYNEKFRGLVSKILQQIKEQDLIKTGELKDHLLVLSLISDFDFKSEINFDTTYGSIVTDIEDQFHRQFLLEDSPVH